MIKCPHCGSSNFYKNGHSHNGSQQYFCKSCHKTFRPSSSKKPKLFSFIYPRCPICGKSMQIYKIRRGFVRFRCKSCKTKTFSTLNVICLSVLLLILCLSISLMSLSTSGSSNLVLFLSLSLLLSSSVLMNLSSFSKTESITSGSSSIGKLRRLLLGISQDIVIILMVSSYSNKLKSILNLLLLMDSLYTSKLLKNYSVQEYIKE